MPCSPYPPAEDGEFSTLVRNHVIVMELAHECRDRHNSLVRMLKEWYGKD